MSSIVKTITTCGRCGAVDEREGASGFVPPIGWASLHLTRRDEGSGWTNNTHLFREDICPACQEIVLKTLEI